MYVQALFKEHGLPPPPSYKREWRAIFISPRKTAPMWCLPELVTAGDISKVKGLLALTPFGYCVVQGCPRTSSCDWCGNPFTIKGLCLGDALFSAFMVYVPGPCTGVCSHSSRGLAVFCTGIPSQCQRREDDGCGSFCRRWCSLGCTMKNRRRSCSWFKTRHSWITSFRNHSEFPGSRGFQGTKEQWRHCP